MLIDWFTVVAQAANFLLLVALLKWLLYDRVIRAMDQRQADIAQRFSQAEEKEEQAARHRDELENQRRELVQNRDKEMDEARREAQEQKEALVNRAREELERKKQDWRRSLRREQDTIALDLAKTASGQVLKISGETLAGFTGNKELAQAVEMFLAKLGALDGEELQPLREPSSEGGVTISSATELSRSDKQKLTRAVHEHIASDAAVGYEIDEGLLFGLVLGAPGVRLAWCAADYLELIQSKLIDALERHVREADTEEAGGDPNSNPDKDAETNHERQ